MAKVAKTKFQSWRLGNLCRGCTECVKGKKLVLYVTGLCHRSCYFCPLSDRRKGKDIIWANEKLVKKDEDIIEAFLSTNSFTYDQMEVINNVASTGRTNE